MSVVEIGFIAVGLSMDALAVAIAKSSTFEEHDKWKKNGMPILFGVFQAIMPMVGAIVGSKFTSNIDTYDHWIIFVVLGFLGVQMIRASLVDEEDDTASISWNQMFILAIATSIDALAVGVTLALLHVNIIEMGSIIGLVTVFLCFLGTYYGKTALRLLSHKVELLGGVILILVGVKILLSHLGFLPR